MFKRKCSRVIVGGRFAYGLGVLKILQSRHKEAPGSIQNLAMPLTGEEPLHNRIGIRRTGVTFFSSSMEAIALNGGEGMFEPACRHYGGC